MLSTCILELKNIVQNTLLFNMVFSAMLLDAFQDHAGKGIPTKYRTDGELFKLSRLKAVQKVSKTVVRDLLFADDCVLNAKAEEKMQHQVNLFSKVCDNFGLTISLKKTEVIFQPEPGKQYEEPNVFVKDQKLLVTWLIFRNSLSVQYSSYQLLKTSPST